MLRFRNKAAETARQAARQPTAPRRAMMEPMEGRVLFAADLGGLELTGEVERTATKQIGQAIPIVSCKSPRSTVPC